MGLEQLFCPRAVAVVGSTAEGKLGYHLVRQVLAGGYQEVYTVNPRAQGLEGAPGFGLVEAIPAAVDLAVIVSPPASVAAVLEDCGRAGVAAAVIISAGFAEAGNSAGEADLLRIARRHGIRLVGPNCAGIVNTGHRLYATLEVRPPAGRTALISQSGALGGAVLAWAEEQGLGFSKFVSYGNRADVNEAELLRYLAEDADTQVVALYVESVADGRAFMDALAACARRKPVVAIKAGRGKAGQRATLSHTGSLAGADAVYDAALAECGALRVKTIEELFDLCKGFVSLPPVRGRRLAIVTNSGGPGVLAADEAEALGLCLPEPGPTLRSRLAGSLPGHCSLRNPIDLTVEGTEAGYRDTVLALSGREAQAENSAAAPARHAAEEAGEMAREYDAVLAMNVGTPYLDSVALARGILAAQRRAGLPVAVTFMAGSTVADGIAYLRRQGMPNFPTGERAAAVLARMAQYHEWLVAAGSRSSGRRLPVPAQASLPLEPMLEPEAMRWLSANGIPVPDLRFVTGGPEAIGAARVLGFPVAMKVVSPDILHKSDGGGVVLNVRDDAGVAAGFEALQRAAAGKDFRGAVIYPMIYGGQEVLLGLSRDPQFGPVVACGLGGVNTEILHDVAVRVAPVDEAEALAMLRGLRGSALLLGSRGRPPCDLDALARTLARLSELPFRYPAIQEVDLNPVFVFPHGLVVGDVRVIL